MSRFPDLRVIANETHARILSLVPTAVGNHLTAAKKEMLSAVKLVIDEEMKWTDKRWENAQAIKAERKQAASAEKDEE